MQQKSRPGISSGDGSFYTYHYTKFIISLSHCQAQETHLVPYVPEQLEECMLVHFRQH